MNLTFYITIAGKSSRMGIDKANLMLGDLTFLEWIVNTIKKLGYSPILITKENDYTRYDIPFITDLNPQIGPLGGLYQSLLHAPTSYVCYLSCDTPMLPVQVIESLINQAVNHDNIVVGFKESIYPLIGIYHKSILPVITNKIQNGNYKMMDLLDKINCQIYPIDAWIHEEILLNCNKAEDFEKLKSYYNKKYKSED